MGLPVCTHLLNGARERLVGSTIVYGRLVLSAICVKRVAMTETVGVVVANYGLPPVGVPDFQLDRVLHDSSAASPIRAAKPNRIRDEVCDPGAVKDIGIYHNDIASRQVGQDSSVAQLGFSERREAVADRVGKSQQQAIVSEPVVLERAPHTKTKAVADQHEGDVVQRVRVAFAQFVRPDDERVVQQAAFAAGLGSFAPAAGQVGQLLAVPRVDLASACSCASSLLSGSCDSSWWPSSMPSQRIRAWPTEFVYCSVADAREVAGEAVHEQIDLHAAEFAACCRCRSSRPVPAPATGVALLVAAGASVPAPSRGRKSRAPRAAGDPRLPTAARSLLQILPHIVQDARAGSPDPAAGRRASRTSGTGSSIGAIGLLGPA